MKKQGNIKDEFNPTKKDLMLIENLILDIKKKKNELVNRKIKIQNNLTELKAKYINVDFNSESFIKIKTKRQKFKAINSEIEIEIKGLNDELIFKNKLKNEIIFFISNNKSLEGKDDLDRLLRLIEDLKTKYSKFTKDRTRIASLRVMANEFIDELEKLK